ncbi:unnamed protein product [Ectocarpus sp. 12 AP-2014]
MSKYNSSTRGPSRREMIARLIHPCYSGQAAPLKAYTALLWYILIFDDCIFFATRFHHPLVQQPSAMQGGGAHERLYEYTRQRYLETQRLGCVLYPQDDTSRKAVGGLSFEE